MSGSSPQIEPLDNPSFGGPVYGLDLFFKIELYALHTAYIVILLTWLYRHIRKELKRDD